jgi:hypothetical protein
MRSVIMAIWGEWMRERVPAKEIGLLMISSGLCTFMSKACLKFHHLSRNEQ